MNRDEKEIARLYEVADLALRNLKAALDAQTAEGDPAVVRAYTEAADQVKKAQARLDESFDILEDELPAYR